MSVRGNLIAIAALGCAFFMGDKWISARATIAPDIANESDFLRIYNPVPLLNTFRSGCLARTGVETGTSSSSGYRFLSTFTNVHYTRTAHMELCDRSQYPTVLQALHKSVVAGLAYTGCKVDSDEFSTAAGVRIAYRCGTRTSGYVTSGTSLAAGDWPASVSLQLNEEWNVRNPM
ncbi:MAG TPA: hypothetical protein VG273_10165 [Bryobacteraceae bacterium]|nr:hypothetical protein [Bryobacteraceae bacterium]